MKNETLILDDRMQALAKKHFALLGPTNPKNETFDAMIRVKGYNDLTLYTADLLKVCIMALGAQGSYSSALIPEPDVNISGVLELVLHMLPYEESALLDVLHQSYLKTQTE